MRTKFSIADAHFNAAKNLARGTEPYLSPIWNTMRIVETTEVSIMAVDKDNRIYINPTYIQNHSADKIAYALLHETLHVAYNDAGRMHKVTGTDEPSEVESLVHNVAVDLVLQQQLQKHHGHQEPDGIVRIQGEVHGLNYPIKYLEVPGLLEGMDAKSYYDLLLPLYQDQAGNGGDIPDEDQEGGTGNAPAPDGEEGDSTEPTLCNPADAGSVSDAQAKKWELGPRHDDALQNEAIKEVGRQAEQHADGSMPGTIANDLHKEISDRFTPKRNWPRECRSAIVSEACGRKGSPIPTYMQMNRYQPKWMARRLGYEYKQPKVSIIIDTSGSMDSHADKVTGIALQGTRQFDMPRVVACDSAIKSAKKLVDARQFKWIGGGGTNMALAIEAEDKLRPNVICVITDGETGWPKRKPRSKVVVCLVSKPTYCPMPPAWAKVVHCYEEGDA